MLKLDTQEPVLGSLQAGKLAGVGAEVVVGGVGQAGTSQGFRGCLRDLKIGHRLVSLVSDLEPLVKEKVGVAECEGKSENG